MKKTKNWNEKKKREERKCKNFYNAYSKTKKREKNWKNEAKLNCKQP